jgi:hypothetical protein
MSDQLTIHKDGKTKKVEFSWDRSNRFSLEEPFDDDMPDYYIIIHDFQWWLDNELEVCGWMDNNLPKGSRHREGALIVVPTVADASKFLLRWQGKKG